MGWDGYGHINTSLPSFIESGRFSSQFPAQVIVAVEREELHLRRMLRRTFDVQCSGGSAHVVVAEWEDTTRPMWWFKVMPAQEYCPVVIHMGGFHDEIDDPLAPLRIYQGGHCGMCYRKMAAPEVDHDHTTDLVRGFLCRSCNQKESKGVDAGVQAYRENPPAAVIGLRVVYGKHRPRWTC